MSLVDGGGMDIFSNILRGAEVLSTILKDVNTEDKNNTVQIIEKQVPTPQPQIITNPGDSRPVVFNLTINVYKDGELVTSTNKGENVIDLN